MKRDSPLYLLIAIMPLALSLLCLGASLIWLGAARQEPALPTGLVTATPHYPPLSGRVFIATRRNCEKFWNHPSHTWLDQEAGCNPHGTPVEILQAVWLVDLEGQGCYRYLVRTVDSLQVGGWIDGDVLTADLARPPQESCFGGTTPTPWLAVWPELAPLQGRAFVIAPGGQADFWSRPEAGEYLFSLPHGALVEIVQSVRLDQSTWDCYHYLARAPDGQQGWIDGGKLAQYPNQCSPENCPQPAVTPQHP